MAKKNNNTHIQGTSQNFAPKKSEKSVICKAIELTLGMETNFGPLTLKLTPTYNLTSVCCQNDGFSF